MKQHILTTVLLLLISMALNAQSSKMEPAAVLNQKIEEFTVSLVKKSDYQGFLKITKHGNAAPFITLNVEGPSYDFSREIKATDFLSFEDFNFDREKEVVIASNSGIYIFDRQSGKPKDLFTKQKDRNTGKEVRNYIFTYRGSYQFNDNEKTITINSSNSAGSGMEEIYKADGTGNLKLTRKCEWDEF